MRGDDAVKALMETIRQDKQLARKFYCLLVCLFSIIAITLAWFFSHKQASSDDVNAVSISAVNMQVSSDGTNYSDSLNFSMPSSLEFTPVSGSGKENKMYLPSLPVNSNDATEATGWQAVTYDESAELSYFYYFTLYFRADKPGCVVLSNISVEPAAPAEQRQSQDYTGKNGELVTVTNNVLRPIKDSPLYSLIAGSALITQDYIAGAARVGLINKTNPVASSTSLQDALIVANDTYRLTCVETNGVCSCTIQENAASETEGSYYTGSALENYSDSSLNVFLESQINSGTTVNILELIPNDDGLYVGHIDVCIWIEGNDNEANEILSQGQILPKLTFTFQDESV